MTDAAHVPVIAAGPTPGPEMAPGADPDAPEGAEPAVARWLRFDGPAAQTVAHVGEWAAGEVRHVEGWLAERLLAHPHFTEVDAPPADRAADEATDTQATDVAVLPPDLTPKARRPRAAPGADDTDAV